MTKKTTKVGANDPWKRPQWEIPDAAAIQALFGGRADPDQQKRAINFIVRQVSAIEYLGYDPTSERNTTFALGKQSVGHFIVELSRFNLGTITGKREQG